MKFLCLACDQPMRLTATAGPDEGSLTVTFACPVCHHRIAMLTNPWETQLVATLGVKVGGRSAEAPAPYAQVRASLSHQRAGGGLEERAASGGPAGEASEAVNPTPGGEGPGCPFAGMIPGPGEATPSEGVVPWTSEAEARAQRIPAFIRPWARQAIERFARERGYGTVTEEVMDQARGVMGL
jgi:hypothetical protein